MKKEGDIRAAENRFAKIKAPDVNNACSKKKITFSECPQTREGEYSQKLVHCSAVSQRGLFPSV